MSFNNKVVIVTGASSDIGATTAVLFAKEGADVAIVARTQSKLEAVAKQIQEYGKKPLVIRADLSKEEDAAIVVPRTIEHFGKLDVLINNAGVSSDGSLLNGTLLQAYDEVMKTNVRSIVQLTTAAAPHLIKTKGNVINIFITLARKRYQNIQVNLAATPHIKPSGFFYYHETLGRILSVSVNSSLNMTALHISKAALDHFTRCAALELASSGVRVNNVSPGPVDNEFLANNNFDNLDERKDSMVKMVALDYIATNEKIGDLILFVASDKAWSITGSTYFIDNGYLLKH